MSSSKTQNLGLNIWAGTDKPSRTEFNENFERLDALKAEDIALESTELVGTNVKAALEGLKSGASDVKIKVANAITGKGVPASATDTGDQLAAKIGQIPTGTDTSDATAVAGDILSGKTAYAKGRKITGTMANRGAGGTVTPGTTDQTKAAGYYSSAITIKGDANLVPQHILSGITLFGVSGALSPGKKWVSGTATASGGISPTHYYITVSRDFGFTPSLIILYKGTFMPFSIYYSTVSASTFYSRWSGLSDWQVSAFDGVKTFIDSSGFGVDFRNYNSSLGGTWNWIVFE